MANHRQVLAARYVKRGASGTTDLAGATRVQIEIDTDTRVSRSGNEETVGNVWRLGGQIRFRVETESVLEWLNATVAADAEETVVVGYLGAANAGGTENRKMTLSKAKVIGVSQGVIPPREGRDQKVPLYEVVFQAIIGGSSQTLAQVFADATDT